VYAMRDMSKQLMIQL